MYSGTNKTKEEAENDIIESIALMNESIAKILAVESIKLTSVNGKNSDDVDKKLEANNINELLEANSSVESMVNSLTVLSFILQKKLSLVVKNPPAESQAKS